MDTHSCSSVMLTYSYDQLPSSLSTMQQFGIGPWRVRMSFYQFSALTVILRIPCGVYLGDLEDVLDNESWPSLWTLFGLILYGGQENKSPISLIIHRSFQTRRKLYGETIYFKIISFNMELLTYIRALQHSLNLKVLSASKEFSDDRDITPLFEVVQLFPNNSTIVTCKY